MTTPWRQNLVMLSLSQLLVMAGFDAMSPFIPLFMKNGLGLTEPSVLAFTITMFNVMGFVAYGIANPLWGWLGDRYGMKVMLLRGTFLTALFWPMMGYVTSPSLLVSLRFVTAFLAGTTAASQMMIARNTPMDYQGFAQGVLLSAYFAGSMLGNLAGGLIIHHYDYRTAFWLCGAMYFLAGLFIVFTREEQDGAPAPEAAPRESGGTAFAAFLQLPRIVWLLLGLFLLNGLVRRTDMPFVALRVEELSSPQTADYWTGIVSFVVGGGAILSGVITGRLVDRISPRCLIVPILAGTGLFTLIQGMGGSLWLFIASRTICYFIAGAIAPMLQKLLTFKTPHNKRGLAFGLSSTAFSIGGILAATLGGLFMRQWGVPAIFIGGGLFAIVFAPVFFAIVNKAMRNDAG